jgi:4'-phosphopantetheinyl transferase EntD
MSAPIDPVLRNAIERLSSSDILVDCRRIQPGDELRLMPEEAGSITSRIPRVRRASGAARLLGRDLLTRLGHEPCAIPRAENGAPRWPSGFVGSFAHDGDVAVAVVAPRYAAGAIGIDVEPAEPLPEELCDLVVTPFERARLGEDPLRGRLLFAAKEAVYKAIAARDGLLLDYQDIDVDLAAGQARLRDGRSVDVRYVISTYVVVLAVMPEIGASLAAALRRERSSMFGADRA